MAHQLGDLDEVHTCIGKARPKRVTQIVKGSIEPTFVAIDRNYSAALNTAPDG